MRAGVAVSADDRQTRQGQPQFGPDDMDDALVWRVEVEELDAEVPAIAPQRRQKPATRQRIFFRAPRNRGNAMARRGEGQARRVNRQTPLGQVLERSGAAQVVQ